MLSNQYTIHFQKEHRDNVYTLGSTKIRVAYGGIGTDPHKETVEYVEIDIPDFSYMVLYDGLRCQLWDKGSTPCNQEENN